MVVSVCAFDHVHIPLPHYTAVEHCTYLCYFKTLYSRFIMHHFVEHGSDTGVQEQSHRRRQMPRRISDR